MRKTKRELIHEGFLTVVRNTYQGPDGSAVTREMVEHPGASVIIPMVGKDELIFVEQFRPGANRKLLELPAGILDKNEDPRTCAKRELEEETGFRAGKLEHLFSAYSSPGIFEEQLHVFMATDLEDRGGQNTDNDEFITLKRMNFRDIRIQLRSGNIKNAITVAALGYLLTFKPYLGKEES